MQDLPDVIDVYCIETPQLDGPYGARGCAEHPMISITSAMGNAIADATGVELFETPFTADKVYLALRQLEEKASLDEDEFVDVIEVTLEEAQQLIADQEIYDAKTVYAVQYLLLKQLREKNE